MIITLLFICQVGGEWVQISQQHYRKPYRSTQHFPAPELVTGIYEEDITSKDNKIYINQSLPDLHWKEAVKMYPRGTVIRVKTNNEHTTKPSYQESDETSSATLVTRRNSDKSSHVQNIGFIIEGDEEEDVTDLYNFKFTPIGNEDHNEEHLYSNAKATSESYQIFNNFDTHYQPSVTESTKNEDVFEGSYDVFPKMGNIKRVQLDSRTVRTPVIKPKPKDDFPKIETEDNKNIIINGGMNKISALEQQVKNMNKTNSITDSQIQIGNDFRTEHTNHENIQQTIEAHQIKNINREPSYFVTKDESTDDDLEATISSDTSPIVKGDNSAPQWTGTSKVPTSAENNANELGENDVKDTVTDENKVNTIENIVKFMKTVADTISRNTRRSVNSKVKYLQNLQDTILTNIKQRIDTAWPEEAASGERRRPARTARAADSTARGHVEFPSSESALMTISFLTFAVYLIKLILQVIHAYKNKTMMMAPAVMATVARTAALGHRHSTNSN